MRKPHALTTDLIRRRWREADARVVLEALDASGLPISRFAEQEGLVAQRVYQWHRRLASSSTQSAPFVEVRPHPSRWFEIVLRSGHVLRVPDSVDATLLRRWVDALE
jgi:hypothetical protein